METRPTATLASGERELGPGMETRPTATLASGERELGPGMETRPTAALASGERELGPGMETRPTTALASGERELEPGMETRPTAALASGERELGPGMETRPTAALASGERELGPGMETRPTAALASGEREESKNRVDARCQSWYNADMMEERIQQQAEDYRIVEQAIRFVERRFREQPGLEEIAASVHLSKYHFQRLFRRWAGISPTQFLHYLTVEYAKTRLRESESVLGATMGAGLSSAGRLHDLFVTMEAMTPGEYRRLGAGLRIAYGFHATPFGQCLAAATARGLCALNFVQDEDGSEALAVLQGRWPKAALATGEETTAPLVDRIFSTAGEADRPFHLLLKGTNFQVRVWQALLAIPPGAMVSYQDVAAYIGMPKASRAVGRAVAENPVAYLIPCHRVITSAGEAHRYRWGTARKKAMLGWEAGWSCPQQARRGAREAQG